MAPFMSMSTVPVCAPGVSALPMHPHSCNQPSHITTTQWRHCSQTAYLSGATGLPNILLVLLGRNACCPVLSTTFAIDILLSCHPAPLAFAAHQAPSAQSLHCLRTPSLTPALPRPQHPSYNYLSSPYAHPHCPRLTHAPNLFVLVSHVTFPRQRMRRPLSPGHAGPYDDATLCSVTNAPEDQRVRSWNVLEAGQRCSSSTQPANTNMIIAY